MLNHTHTCWSPRGRPRQQRVGEERARLPWETRQQRSKQPKWPAASHRWEKERKRRGTAATSVHLVRSAETGTPLRELLLLDMHTFYVTNASSRVRGDVFVHQPGKDCQQRHPPTATSRSCQSSLISRDRTSAPKQNIRGRLRSTLKPPSSPGKLLSAHVCHICVKGKRFPAHDTRSARAAAATHGAIASTPRGNPTEQWRSPAGEGEKGPVMCVERD